MKIRCWNPRSPSNKNRSKKKAPLKMNGRNLKKHYPSLKINIIFRIVYVYFGSKFCSEVQQGISFGFPSVSMFRLRNTPKHLRNIICYNSVIGAIEGAVTWKCHSRCCMPSAWAHLRLALFPWLLWVYSGILHIFSPISHGFVLVGHQFADQSLCNMHDQRWI